MLSLHPCIDHLTVEVSIYQELMKTNLPQIKVEKTYLVFRMSELSSFFLDRDDKTEIPTAAIVYVETERELRIVPTKFKNKFTTKQEKTSRSFKFDKIFFNYI